MMTYLPTIHPVAFAASLRVAVIISPNGSANTSRRSYEQTEMKYMGALMR